LPNPPDPDCNNQVLEIDGGCNDKGKVLYGIQDLTILDIVLNEGTQEVQHLHSRTEVSIFTATITNEQNAGKSLDLDR
jgi:hypothetical protein